MCATVTPAVHASNPIPASPALWAKVFRQGIAPLMSNKALKALWDGLCYYDPRLLTGATCMPLPVPSNVDEPIRGACAIGYCGWKGEGLETVGEIEEFFVRVCFECDNLMGELGSYGWFLNWFDSTPDEDMRIGIMMEINGILAGRAQGIIPIP